MRILVVEDEPDLARLLALGLGREGFAVDGALDGQEALDRLEQATYDVVVLDRDLPKVHGDRVCRALVERGTPSRILMRTAADAAVRVTVMRLRQKLGPLPLIETVVGRG